MTRHETQLAMTEIYKQVPLLQPSDLEVSEMFQDFLNNFEKKEEVVSLPRGYDQ